MAVRDNWTLETLRTFLCSRIDALEERSIARNAQVMKVVELNKEAQTFALNAVDKAIAKAEQETDKRFESVNEFRNALQDQSRTFIPRAEVEIQLRGILDRFDALNNLISAARSQITTIEVALRTKKESSMSSIGTVVAIVSVIYGVIATLGIVITLMLHH